MAEEYKCPICGEPTLKFYGNYRKDRLCPKHANELKNDEIKILDYHSYLKVDDDSSFSTLPVFINNNDKVLNQELPDELIYILVREGIISASAYNILPSSGFNRCILCGEKSSDYAFCKNCYYKYPQAEIIRKFLDYSYQEENSKKESTADIIENTNANVCIVCETPTKNGYDQCDNCYLETREYRAGIDKNSTISELRQYYYNLKDYIYRTKDIERAKTNCNKLIAIATTNSTINQDNSLANRVYRDVIDLLEKKRPAIPENKGNNKENMKTQEEKKVYLLYSMDGHALDSDMEIKIDDILYSSEIFHCCHKPVTDITEKSVVSDWFIPIDSINKGIFIEYNGMNTPKYIKNKEENIELYKKYNLPLIIIERDEPKNDTQTFTTHLIKEIQSKAIEYFGKMPKWKK